MCDCCALAWACMLTRSLPDQAPEPEDLAFCGALEYYDKAFDRVTPKTERPLKRTSRAFRSVTTSDDPVIRRAPGGLLPLCLLSTGLLFLTRRST